MNTTKEMIKQTFLDHLNCAIEFKRVANQDGTIIFSNKHNADVKVTLSPIQSNTGYALRLDTKKGAHSSIPLKSDAQVSETLDNFINDNQLRPA